MAKLNDFEVEVLAGHLLGKSEDEVEEMLDRDDGTLDELLFEKYNVEFEQFYKLINDLIKFTPIVSSGLTGSRFHAFVAGNVAIAKLVVAEDA